MADIVNACRPVPNNGGPTAVQLIIDLDVLMARLNGLRGNPGSGVVNVDDCLTKFGVYRTLLQQGAVLLNLSQIDQEIQSVNRSLDLLQGAGGVQIQIAAPQPPVAAPLHNAPPPPVAAPPPIAPQHRVAAPQPQGLRMLPSTAANTAAPQTANVNGWNSMSAQAAMARGRASGRNSQTMQGGAVASSADGDAGSKRDANGNPKP